MSAYLVSNKLINVIMNNLTQTEDTIYFKLLGEELNCKMTDELEKLGQEMQEENIRSLKARYGEDDDLIDEEKYIFSLSSVIKKPMAIYKAISCWQYQTSESDDYYLSDVWIKLEIIQSIIASRIINSLKEYNDSKGWDDF